MNGTLVVLRLIHIGVGVFWAGAIIFVGLFLEPSVRAAGPAGGEVMKQIQARRYSMVMPIAGLLVILTGFDLLRRDFPGGPSAWVASSGGRVFLIGGTAALLTLIVGVTVILPTVKRISALMASAPVPGSAEATELGVLRRRFTMLSRFGVMLVMTTVICMAVARYVG